MYCSAYEFCHPVKFVSCNFDSVNIFLPIYLFVNLYIFIVSKQVSLMLDVINIRQVVILLSGFMLLP